MNEPHDLNRTVDHSSAPADSLDAGLAAGFAAPCSGPGAQLPGPLKEAAGDSARPTAAADALPEVPGYRVLHEIARGGMGRVLAARDLTLDRDVALKVLLPGTSSDRFVRESKITARLPHPGIPPVHALGTLADGSPFLAMKLIAGRTLAEEMKSGDRPRLLQAFTQVCQAVGFAHSRGIIHRDLKPANVMVGAFGEVQVMDWGLAKDLTNPEVEEQVRSAQQPEPSAGTDPNQTTEERAADESTGARTQAGAVMGTPAYMAPEQARGESTDARADVFALGGILCAILTGRPPYSGKSLLAVIRRAGAADLGEAHARLDDCGADAELVALCRGCLSPSPADRPTDGQAVADALTSYLDGVQERLRRAELERVRMEGEKVAADLRMAEQRRRFRLTLALAGSVLLLVLGGAFIWVQAQKTWDRQERNAEAVAGLLDQAEKALQAGNAARAQIALDAAGKRAAEGGAEQEAERLARLEAELTLLRELDRVDNFRWTWLEHRYPDEAVVATRTHAALARFGADPEAVALQDAAARVETSVVRQRIVAVLDRLLRQERKAEVRALLRRVDADPHRDAVRDAVLAGDRTKFVGLVDQPATLEQPPGFIEFLGKIQAIPAERRLRLLAAAVGRSPGDLGLLMALGGTYFGIREDRVDEQLRWLQAAVSADPDNFAARINLGTILLDGKRDYDGAITCFEKAISLDPKAAGAHNNLGNVLWRKGKLDEAMKCYRKAIALDPEFAMAHSNLGMALQEQGKVEEAIASHRKAIALAPQYALAHTNLGNALQAKGKVDEAIACHRKAIELDPKLPHAHNNLGFALLAKKDLVGAEAAIRKAIVLDPKLAPAHSQLGAALHEQGKVEEAIASHRKAIDFDPKLAMAHSNLGKTLQEQGKVEEAIACYRKAIALDPNVGGYHYNLGISLVAKGQVDDAIASFKKGIELDPMNAGAHTGLGNALKDKGKVDEAIECCKKAIELNPEAAWAHTNLGTIFCDVKRDYDAAITCFKKAIELEPQRARGHYCLGNALKDNGQLDAAITSYRKAIALDPKNAQAHTNLGVALKGKGKVDEAIGWFQKAIALDPKLAQAHNNLGFSLDATGKQKEAIEAWREAVSLDPGLTMTHYWLGKALVLQGRPTDALVPLGEAAKRLPDEQARGLGLPGERSRARRLSRLEKRLPDLLAGKDRPGDNRERLDLSELCQRQHRFAAAARFFMEAFRTDAKLTDDLTAGHRYNAACYAALAAAGQGEDSARLSSSERLALRRQALTWLRADLAARGKQLKSWRPGEAAQARQALMHWQKDTDLAGLRDRDALARRSAEERAACEKLWADVSALLKKAEGPAKKEGTR